MMATYVLAVLIGGIWMIRMIREKRVIFKRTMLDIPILIFLFSNLLSLSLSIDARVSWYGYYSRWNGGLLSLLTYAFLYWAFVSNITRRQAVSSIKYLVLSGVIISVYGMFEHFGHSISCLLVIPNHTFDVACWVQDVQNRVFATLGQPNWMAAYLVAMVFIPIQYLTLSPSPKSGEGSRSWVRCFFNVLIFIILFLALLFTKSRSGFLAFGLGSVVFWILQFTTPISPSYVGGGRKRVVLFIFWTLIIGFSTFAINNPIREIFIRNNQEPIINNQGTSLEVGGTESGSIRKIVWTGAVRIWLGNAKNFFLGTGPETFALSYYQYRPTEHNRTSEWELLYNKAHNEYLNQLATTGLLGLVSYIVLLATMLINFKFKILNLNSNFEFQISNLQVALLSGWLTILVTNFWGFSVVITQLFLFLFPAISIIISDQESATKKSKEDIGGKQVLSIIGVILAVGYLLFAIGKYWYSDYLYAKAQNYYRYFASTNQSSYIFSALDLAQRAFLSGHEPTIGLDLVNYSALVASALGEENSTASAQLTKVVKQTIDYLSSVSIHNPSSLKSVAKAQIILGNYVDAYKLLKAAEKISPTDPKIPLSLGVVSLGLGKKDEAKQYFEKALLLKPDWPDPQKQLGLLK